MQTDMQTERQIYIYIEREDRQTEIDKRETK